MIHDVFALVVSPLELFIRGSIIWWFIFLVFRYILRRNMGELGAADILLLVLVADAASNGMADDYTTVTEGLVLISTLFFWNWLIDALALRFEWAEKLTNPPAVQLVRNGRYVRRNIKSQRLNEKDVFTEIRKNGIDNVEDVKAVWFESDGSMSVIPKDKAG